MASSEEATSLSGQSKIRQLMYGFIDSMALKYAVELGIPDILHSHHTPLTLSQIASGIDDALNPDMVYLERIMKFLVSKEIFSVDYPRDGGEARYSPTQNSKWLLRDSESSYANVVLMLLHPLMQAPWQCFPRCVKEGGFAFDKAHGCDMWEFASRNPEFNEVLYKGMACTAANVTRVLLTHYKDGLKGIGSLVDAGGGNGRILAEIVKVYPHIKATNFDLPHVVANAPKHEGVSHVAGSILDFIPNADAVFMRGVLHDFSDDDCIKVMKNCRKAMPERGKLILMELVLQEGDESTESAACDLLLVSVTTCRKGRDEMEWNKLLQLGGFPTFKIIKVSGPLSIIEAHPLSS